MAVIALARMTVADGLRQPLTWLTTLIAVVLVVLSYVFGMFNFETQDRIRMLCTAGVAVGVLNGLFLAVVGASTAIHEELASRTALTLFAKPMPRGSFLLGKALGIWLVVVLSLAVVALAHAAALGLALYTGFEDLGDNHDHGSLTQGLSVPWDAVIAAHLLSLAHTAILTCLAAVLALRLPLIANILACFALFVLGHLLPGLDIMGAVLVPALAAFNIDDALQLPGQRLSWTYCGTACLYAVLYCAGCLLVGLAVFKRQDIP
ncbi:MAG: hypothetical protein H0W72_16020 [Planctomycetes bacterium]|nr:hypothetical protein [Planctomycetota bacterium]